MTGIFQFSNHRVTHGPIRIFRVIIYATVLCSIAAITTIQAASAISNSLPAGEYRFGVFPYLSPVRLEQIYAPVGAVFQKASNSRFHLRTGADFKRFFQRLAEGHYDVALIQPFWYPPAVDKFGYIPLARMREPFTSLIVVPDDSPLRSASDLRGKVIATPPAFVPVVYLARKALIENGITPNEDVTMKAFKSVDSCFQQIFIGRADACVAPPFAPSVVEEKMQVKLRVLLETPSIPNLTLVAHHNLPEQTRNIIREQILNLHTSPGGKQLLAAMKTAGFIPVADEDYDTVRELLRTATE